MPDTPIEPSGRGRYPADMEARVAVLEQIARDTAATLQRLERRFDAVDHRFDNVDRRIDAVAVAEAQRAEFRWLLGVVLGGFATVLGGIGAMLGVMAHGFHWL
jgi:hypothetical protein